MQKKTYLNECLQNKVLTRWADQMMPLTFYIAPFRWYKSKEDANSQYKYKGMVIDALNMWAKATDNRFSFKVVEKLHDSMVNLDWKRVDRKSLGHCYFNYDSQARLYSAEVMIGISDGVIHQQYMNDNEVRHTIIHEIGHALGLQHSPFKNDIMYVPHQYGVTNATACDKLTLNWLYRLPYGVPYTEIIKSYSNSNAASLDEMIFMIMNNQSQTGFENAVNNSSLNMPKQKDLLTENENLGNINLYNVSLQDIKAPDNIKEYIKKIKLNKPK